MKKKFLMIVGILFPVWIAAQTVTVDFNAKRQTMIANGINMEGYHVGQWDELSGDKKEMLETLPCQVARIGAPMVEWESSNDNDDPDVINWDGFNKNDIAVIHSVNRIRRMKNEFNVDVWLSFWNLPNWILKNPNSGKPYDYQAGRQINNIDEFAESICALLVYIKEQTGVEVKWVSFNESLQQDKADGGWGGYNTVLSVDENIRLFKKAGQLFEKHGLGTKWMIGSLCFRPSELRQAKEILADPEAKKYIDGVDFHSYELQYGSQDQLEQWGDFFATCDVPTFCGELDNYKSDYKGGDWISHGMPTGKMYYQIYKYSYSAGSYPWFPGSPKEESTYRYVDLHYFAHIPPGYTVVEANSNDGNLYAIGACKDNDRVMILQNNSGMAKTVEISGFPELDGVQVYESYVNNYGVRNDKVAKYENGILKISMKPYSLYSVGTNLAEIATLRLGEQAPEGRIEAEGEMFGDGSVVATGVAGYSGWGYVDFGGVGSWAGFIYEQPSAGTYDVKISYSCSTDRTCEVYVNDEKVSDINLPSTGTSWNQKAFPIPMVEGTNTIKFVAALKSGPNFDYYEVGSLSSGIEATWMNQILVYPSIVTDKVTYNLSSDFQSAEMNLINATGTLVKQFPIEQQEGNIDFSDLSSGIYFLQIIDSETGKSNTYKLLKR